MGRLGRPSNDTEANSPFGASPGRAWHNGTDWGWGQGDGVCAMAAGTVVQVAKLSDYGLTVKIDHGDLIAKSTMTRYTHLASVGPKIKVGYEIARGEDLGLMGNTGSLANKTKHLHSELWLDGKRVDEQPYQREADMKANARVIASGGAKRREQPTTAISDNFDPAENFAGGDVVEWDGFVRSTLKGGSDDGDNIWLVKDGLYTKWTTTVAVPGAGALAGIKDLGTYVPPVVAPPVVTPPATSGVTKAELATMLAASEKKILDAIAGVPGKVVDKFKEPGN